MAEQPASGTTAGSLQDQRLNAEVGAGEHHAHHGRTGSWVTTGVVVIGFIVGGVALTIGPSWVLFWVGCGIVVLGAIVGAAVHIFDDWY